mmetsp:Transcript_60715/g.142015  ORF Transcript_60715/g.142015 Transcript_60715/m.142015 type:complete len:93 (-) Transcript_60715:31-309(-)
MNTCRPRAARLVEARRSLRSASKVAGRLGKEPGKGLPENFKAYCGSEDRVPHCLYMLPQAKSHPAWKWIIMTQELSGEHAAAGGCSPNSGGA